MTNTLKQLWLDTDYVYAIMSSGLDIYNISSNNKVAFIYNEGGFTSVWGNAAYIYLGTTTSGLKFLDKTTISGGDLISNLQNYSDYYNTSSDVILYLHGYEETLAVVTTNSIDILNNGSQGFKSTISGTYFNKCFMTSKNELYYTTQGPTGSGICKINSIKCDWDVSDTFYTIEDSLLATDQEINDFFVTENTSSDGSTNTLFVATSSGVHVLDEGTLEFDTYYSKEG